ncbi:DUF5985 family protein [Caenimonas koreensis]|uniref:Uncharacterized protein n=1 Tax=Caenimonas koreensis DSM 17982 TaxID=1121255 RepID=A0A844AT53_9BURK|nr:DUF5985 family protein [Caenimonas koreensis]MRD47515.1 hypothetical protein [Caenimonas koreensis DSM 17982]
MQSFLIGAIAATAFVAALIFFRFYRQTRDRFFIYFGVAFILEGVHRIPEAFHPGSSDDTPQVYLIRLLGYLLILYAIWQKNRNRP